MQKHWSQTLTSNDSISMRILEKVNLFWNVPLKEKYGYYLKIVFTFIGLKIIGTQEKLNSFYKDMILWQNNLVLSLFLRNLDQNKFRYLDVNKRLLRYLESKWFYSPKTLQVANK